MKQKLCAILIFAVMLSLFAAACSPQKAEKALDAVEDAVEQRLDPVEDAIDRQLDAMEDAIEGEVRITPAPVPKADVPAANVPAADTPVTVTPKTDSVPVSSPLQVPATPDLLTKDEAAAIALKHAGFAAADVSWLHTEYDVDDGVPEYDVQFHHGRWEYEYEIHAQTGKILSFEKDD